MNTPLDIAVDIGRVVADARAARLALDLSDAADGILARNPQSGLSRSQVLAALQEEAGAVGLSMN